MNRRFICSIWLLCIGMALSAQTTGILSHMKDTVACNKWVEEQLAGMTLKQKIGQLFIHTVAPVTTQKNKENIAQAVKEYAVGGLLFSGGTLDKQVQLTNWAQQMAKVPLMITFDGEWGLAMRLKEFPAFPRNRILGCIQSDTLLYRYGREVARQLREIGVCVNFAPVADVDNNPKNPVINTRSFGSNPREVARKVIAYSRGLEDGGVMAVCKHFPGHGDTEVDSHHALPVLNFDRARLDSVELLPFRQAINAGISGMMAGHLNVPALGKKPASVSPDIVRGVLQGELKFSGLTFTDALAMKGISGSTDLCAQALIAGNDMLLATRNLKRELDGVLAAIRSGKLSEETINQKCRKVLTYKYALGMNTRPEIRTEGLKQRIYTDNTEKLMKDLDKAAVTLLKDSDYVLPLDLSLSGTVLLSVSSSLTKSAPFYQRLRETVDLSWMRANTDSLSVIRQKLRAAQRVIVALYEKDCTPYARLIKEIAGEKDVVFVCFTSQKSLEKIPSVMEKVTAVVLAHMDTPSVQRYVADAITGKTCIDGRLSVGVSGLWTAGTGIVLDPDRPRRFKPEDFGLDSRVLSSIDSIAQEGIRAGAFPGCHVLIQKEGYPVYNKCFGHFTYDEASSPVTENDLYDLASLSKATGTLLAVMKLYDEGRLGLTDKISRYVPQLAGTDKQNITVQELLYHESGLPSYLPFYMEVIDKESCKGGLYSKRKDESHQIQIAPSLYISTDYKYKPEWISRTYSADYPLQIADSLFIKKEFRDLVLKELADAPLKNRSYRYSCLNFMLLKEMVENISGMPMDSYLDSVFYKPMGLTHTLYNPLNRFKKEKIVPSVAEDFLRGGVLQGYVHDEATALLGGVSGNAGLFSTAREVAAIFQMIMDRGIYGDRRYLSRNTCDLFMTMKSKNSRRGLGFDKPDMKDAAASPCATEAPATVFGHTGFTGTCAWADPDNNLVFVFLSNRIYPEAFGRNLLMKLNIRPRMQQAMYQSLKK